MLRIHAEEETGFWTLCCIRVGYSSMPLYHGGLQQHVSKTVSDGTSQLAHRRKCGNWYLTSSVLNHPSMQKIPVQRLSHTSSQFLYIDRATEAAPEYIQSKMSGTIFCVTLLEYGLNFGCWVECPFLSPHGLDSWELKLFCADRTRLQWYGLSSCKGCFGNKRLERTKEVKGLRVYMAQGVYSCLANRMGFLLLLGIAFLGQTFCCKSNTA